MKECVVDLTLRAATSIRLVAIVGGTIMPPPARLEMRSYARYCGGWDAIRGVGGGL